MARADFLSPAAKLVAGCSCGPVPARWHQALPAEPAGGFFSFPLLRYPQAAICPAAALLRDAGVRLLSHLNLLLRSPEVAASPRAGGVCSGGDALPLVCHPSMEGVNLESCPGSPLCRPPREPRAGTFMEEVVSEGAMRRLRVARRCLQLQFLFPFPAGFCCSRLLSGRFAQEGGRSVLF